MPKRIPLAVAPGIIKFGFDFGIEASQSFGGEIWRVKKANRSTAFFMCESRSSI